MKRMAVDAVMTAAFVAYNGMHASLPRRALVERWGEMLSEAGLPNQVAEGLSALEYYTDGDTRRMWVGNGLPNDPHSMENAMIVTKAVRWMCAIDPDLVVVPFIQKLHPRTFGFRDIVVTGNLEDDDVDAAYAAAAHGHFLVISLSEQGVHPGLGPLVACRGMAVRSKQARATVMTTNQVHAPVEVHPDCTILFLCRDVRASFLVEHGGDLNLVDFSVTAAGLRAALLKVVDALERPWLVEKLSLCQKRLTAQQRVFAEVEARMLAAVGENSGKLLEATGLLGTLNEYRAARALEERIAKTVEEAQVCYLSQYSLSFHLTGASSHTRTCSPHSS